MSEELFIKKLYKDITDLFTQNNSSAKTELHYETPFQLLVAVILSAQCTDKRVNIVTKGLFKHFPDPDSLSKASFQDVFSLIKSVSYPNSKARYIIQTATILVSKHSANVPKTYDDLVKLPGVGRKTANVLLAELFNSDVIAVDTHVFRVSKRIGLVKDAKTALEVEKQLTKYISPGKKAIFHHWLILHGRYICKARRPDCKNCIIKNICNFNEKIDVNN